MEQNKAKLYSKISGVMDELSRIPKNGFNKDQSYHYATSEDVKQAIRQAMAKNKLALLFELPEYTAEEIVSRNGTKGTKLRGRLEFTIACGETGETVTKSIWAEAVDWQDKAFNKLYTTGEKYFLITTFLVSTGDEDDADAADKAEIKETGQRQHKQQPPQQKTEPPHPQPTNGNGNGTGARDARGVMDYILPLVQSKPDWVAQPASQAQIGFVSSVLEECFAGSGDADKRRRSVLAHLFNVDSAKQLNKSQAAATLTWLVDGKDDGGKPMLRKHATSEAVAVERAYLMQSAQAAMFDAAPTGYTTEGDAA